MNILQAFTKIKKLRTGSFNPAFKIKKIEQIDKNFSKSLGKYSLPVLGMKYHVYSAEIKDYKSLKLPEEVKLISKDNLKQGMYVQWVPVTNKIILVEKANS